MFELGKLNSTYIIHVAAIPFPVDVAALGDFFSYDLGVFWQVSWPLCEGCCLECSEHTGTP